MKVKHRKTWSNTINRYQCQPFKYFEPEDIYDLQQIVREAELEGVRVRAVGSGHSFSDVAMSSGYLVSFKHLDKLLDMDVNLLRVKDHYHKLVHVEGGLTIEKFNKLMCKKNLCVVNMGGIDNQTLAGAISTGTHGTGIDLPAFHAMVRSVVLVAAGGHVYRIEPADGITNPHTYAEKGIKLVQDDHVFNSVLVSLGCMGIIYSFILELDELYYLREAKSLMLWRDLKPMLADRSLFEKDGGGMQRYRGIMVQLNPYPNRHGEHTCVVVRHQLLKGRPRRSFNDLTRNLTSSTLGNMPFVYRLTAFAARRLPKLMPWILERSLHSLKDKSYENIGYKVLYQGVEYIKIRAYDCEFAFDLADNSFIEALEEVMEKAQYLARNNKLYQTSPLGLRFVRASSAYMSPCHNRNVCYIDTPFLVGTIGGDLILDTYQDIMLRHEGVPHWGKINNRLNGRPDLIEKHYQMFPEWLKVQARFNPDGTFDNNFSERLRLSARVQQLTRESEKELGRKLQGHPGFSTGVGDGERETVPV
ncbi:D-arabinono-1,4-lactone oxidase [Cesiribacter sp. SM1]|uniref:D-arabinono-1,4-lactone oxidase n=1 Tax=Cesiribacter sp. SM1 TaxID=2861196 RepID=UPI001CD7102E|nr:D-arabinono-1,4-lactone oxidase [Cesiribacter sp. SM1]